MLIAIMGDSFERVFENRETHNVRMRLQILGDLSAVLPQQSEEQERKTFFVVAKPIEDEDDEEGDEWEGTLKRLTRIVERKAKVTQEMLDSKVNKLQTIIEDSAKKELDQNRNFKDQIEQQVTLQCDKVNTQVAQQSEKVNKQVAQVKSEVAQVKSEVA